MKHKCILCASLVALLFAWTQAALGDVYALPDGLTQLKGQSYWLKSKITTLIGGKLCKMESDEFFSSWQQRSRIDYRILCGDYASDWLGNDKIPTNGIVYADERNVLLIPKQVTGGFCVRLSLKLVTKMFTMGALGSNDEQKAPQSLIGPSRLLQSIADQVYKLTLADETKLLPLETFRRIPDVIKLVHNGLPGGASLSLYYSNNQEQNLAHGVPKEMHLLTADKKLVIYEFQKVTLLNQDNFVDLKSLFLYGNRLQFQHMTLNPDSSQLTFDLFGWNRGGGCSKALTRSQLDDRLNLVGLDRKEFRFSFTGQVNTLNLGEASEITVGYEPTISTLRVNKIGQDEIIESTINYQQMRNYHVVKKQSNQMQPEGSSNDLQRSEGNGGEEALDGDKISCVMTPATAVTARDPLSRGIKLGDMLLGSIKFTYLGRAKVRGIDALMFESPESEWPIWLEPPALIYKSDSLKMTALKQTVSRPAGGFISESEYRLNTVIYLSASMTGGQDQAKGKSDYQEPIALNNKLLFIEFFEFHKKSNELLRTFSISIYDFAWHIANGGIGNRPYTDFFAIADECPRDDHGAKELARVDLILAIEHAGGNQSVSKFDGASGDAITDGWLWDDVKRNLAILQAIYLNAKLPSSLVHDFRSRLRLSESLRSGTIDVKDSKMSQLSDRTQVAVSFQMADHVKHLDELIFMGIGCVKPSALAKFRRFTLKFRDCSLMAGHQKLETIFGFDPILNHCHVYMRHVFGATLALLVGSTLTMDNANCFPKLEIYQTTRSPADETNRLVKFEFSAPKKIGLFPVLDDGNEDAREGSPIWYNAELIGIKLSQPSQATTSGANLESESRLLPFGLVPTSAMNTPIVADGHDEESSVKQKTWAETHLRHPINELTFGQCQTQCLVTPECDAFSFCQRAEKVECVLTRANLRSDTSLRKLTELANDKSITLGQTFEVDASPEGQSGGQKDHKSRVALRKHPACGLHFKDYMALTRRQDVAQVRWAHNLARLKPVKDREECAKRCLQRTISTLMDEVEPLSRLSAQTLRGLDEKGANLQDLYQQHRAAHSRICPTFLYLDAESCDAKLIERLRETHTKIGSNETDQSGFCSIAGEQSPSEQNETHDLTDSEVVSEKHQMDFSLMYDKHFGISLLESSLSSEEKIAFDAVLHTGDKPLTLDDSKVLEAFVDRGDNHAKYFYATDDVTYCAKACVLAQPVWPACKSFSVEESFALGTGKPLLTCRMNSVTLSEVLAKERYDLILEQKSPGETQKETATGNSTVLYWHYEPRPSFMGRSVEWSAKLQAGHDLWGATRQPTGTSTLRLSALWFLACIFIIMVLGTKLGVALGKRFIMNLQTIAEDNENLVNGMVVEHSDPLTSGVPIEFKSLATCYEEPENEAKAEREKESDS